VECYLPGVVAKPKAKRATYLCIVLLAACGEHATPTSTTPATASAAGSQLTVGAAVAPVADVWKTGREDEYLKAADCPAFTKVPTRIERSTIVEGPCIEITEGATVAIAQDMNLVIVATRKLRIGDGAKIVGRGAKGASGTAARTATKDWAPAAPNQSEKINCACRGAHCRPGWESCSADNDEELRGGRGGRGRRGASVVMVAREFVVGAGLSIDVSGGLGGEAGTSGRAFCRYGGMECSSPPATNDGDGEGGTNGTITLRAALPSALPMMFAIERIATPPSAVSKQAVETIGAFRRAVHEAQNGAATYESTPGLP
jgi:hypothetical protein